MICRNIHEGELLEVNDLNKINVCIDRSETSRTETALNSWRPGLTGPPHLHESKEQIFLIISGVGRINAGDEVFDVQTGDLVYIPAKTLHQSIVAGEVPLQYFLFNAYLTPDKEGHASFKDHVSKVKDIRSKQAREQDPGEIYEHVGKPTRKPKLVKNTFSDTENPEKLLLEKVFTEKCEAISYHCSDQITFDNTLKKELTLYFYSGKGSIIQDEQTQTVRPGDVVFVSVNTSFSIIPEEKPLNFISLNTIL